jgi:hypothetical protein
MTRLEYMYDDCPRKMELANATNCLMLKQFHSNDGQRFHAWS